MKGKLISIMPDQLNGGHIVMLHVDEVTTDTLQLRDTQELRLALLHRPSAGGAIHGEKEHAGNFTENRKPGKY